MTQKSMEVGIHNLPKALNSPISLQMK